MELMQKDIHMDRIKCRTQAQVTLEDDINITDTRPDVYQLVTEKGRIEIEEVRATEDHVHVKGLLYFSVLYISEEEVHRPACMEGQISFSETVFAEGVTAGDQVMVRPVLEDLSVGMINSRKLSVQALIGLSLAVEEMEEMRPLLGINGSEAVELQKKTLQALHLAIQKKDIFRIKQEIELPNGLPNIFMLLWEECQLKEFSCRIMDGKMLLQGEISVFFLYEGEGEQRPAMWYETTVPVNGTLECAGMQEGMLEDISCRIGHKEMEIRADADGEERKVLLELVLDLDMKLYQEKQVETIADLYGVDKEIEAVRQQGSYKQLLMKNTGRMKTAARFKTAPGMPAIQQICACFGRIVTDNVEVSDQGLVISGAANVQILYTAQDSELPFFALKGSIPFSYVLEAPEAAEGCVYKAEPAIEQLSVSMLDADEAEVRAQFSFQGFLCREETAEVITDIQVSDPDPRKRDELPGIVAYIVQEGDSLWKIGKRYYVPMERMRTMNELSSDEVKPGEKLLIVKGF